MTCLNCSAELVSRRRIKKDMSGLALNYFHCPLCSKNFNVNQEEIILEGDGYRLKKDTIDPQEAG